MDRRFNEPTELSSSTDRGLSRRSVSQPQQPDCSSPAVQEALRRLASIDLFELCNEAKLEHCRATRDLRSCGRCVKHALHSCGHAALCAECSWRCDLCPICRAPISKDGDKLRLRLYYEFVEAKLICENCDEIFNEDEEDGEQQLTADVQRLYSFFDIALDYNLVSLICHYVTDVCMDESAVSSDPVITFLLDEVVVKDWCKRTFHNIITELRGIYSLEVEEMEASLTTLLKYSVQLAGISNVLEVLASSFKDSLSAQLHDLHHLQESILKTKQHMGVMIWCIRHQFLKSVSSRHADAGSWHSLVRERKLTAIERSWPDAVNFVEESACQEGSLFIEDALANIETEHGYMQEAGEELELAHMQNHGISSVFKSKIEGVASCYPFESVRAAVDLLFLRGSSSMEVAKQAIFLYYLFDRHWTIPDDVWRPIIEDFAASFSIARNLLLESKVFYLLDDHKDEALKEACRLLPEISGPTTHPKIAHILLERGNPDVALMVLRWSGRDGASEFISLREAVTTVRVRVECGFLTEAFLHQRMLCAKVRGKEYGPSSNASDDSGVKCGSWKNWVEVLVTEICCLCIRRNMVDRMIELPWNSDEEIHIHKCLLDHATNFPSSIFGSLLVVYYIQRHRYSEAYKVDVILKNVDNDFISENSARGESISEKSIGDEVLSRMRSISGWRAGLVVSGSIVLMIRSQISLQSEFSLILHRFLVMQGMSLFWRDKCMALLPEVQCLQVMTGKMPESTSTFGEVEMHAMSDLAEVHDSKSTSLLIPSSKDHFITPWPDQTISFSKSSALETSLFGPFDHDHSGLGKDGSSVLQERLFDNAHKAQKPPVSLNKIFKYVEKSTPVLGRASHSNASPFKDLNRSSSRGIQNSIFQRNISDAISPEMGKNKLTGQFQSTTPYSNRFISKRAATPSSNSGLFKDFSVDFQPSVLSNGLQLDRDQRPDDSMDFSWSYEREHRDVNDGPRWRLDETSDDEEDQSPKRAIRLVDHTTPVRGVRRSRFAI